jgi:uncharacterized protein (TIGR03083 family)
LAACFADGQDCGVLLADAAVIDVRPVLTRERHLLVELFASVSDVQWTAPTALPGWRVKDVALHVLDDDFGRLARDRDGDDSGFIEVSGGLRELVVALNAKNERWVVAASGLSRRLAVELLAWSGDAIDRYLRDVDLDGASTVGWAGDDQVPAWFDLAREFTERWVHHQQIRDALDLPAVS